MFIPVVGCIIYLITQVYNKRDAEKVQSELVTIIDPGRKVRELEKRLQFSDSYQNRVDVADAYLEIKSYKLAIPHYLEALEDHSQNSFYVINNLVEAYYHIEDYDNVVLYAERILKETEFKKSKAQFVYALAQEQLENFEVAETHLKQLDIRFSFYEERLVLAQFLLKRNKTADAKDVLESIYEESQHMTKPNKRLYYNTIQEVKQLLQTL